MVNSIFSDADNNTLDIHFDMDDCVAQIFGEDYSIDVEFEYEVTNVHIDGDGHVTPEDVYYDTEINCTKFTFFDEEGDEVEVNFNDTELGLIKYRLLEELKEVVSDQELYK